MPLAVPVPAGSYPVQYASPALSSADGSPITNLHAVDVVSTPQAQVIVYKTASPVQRRQEAGAGSSAAATPTTVAYSSVIQSTLQQQQQQQNLCWTKLEDNGAGQEDIKNVLQLQVKQEHRQLDFASEASSVDAGGGGENLVFNLPPGLEIKQTFYPASVVDGEQLQLQEHNQNQSQSSGRRQHVVANMIMSPSAGNLASQIQVVPKVCI